MAAPAFLTCFPVYCPHIPAHAFEKRKEDISRMLQPRSQATPSCLGEKTWLQDTKKSRISSHKRFLQEQPFITKKEKQ